MYQIGEVQARSCPVSGTTSGGGSPAFTVQDSFIDSGVQYALAAPYPDPSQVDEDVYA